ncbi:MAG TPA: hypothetical protein PL041_12340 [Melioribacteraceae bacterium]|nr:hypothetical protein [Melioribacteraceae bacterium]
MKPKLTLQEFIKEAKIFCNLGWLKNIPELYGITDGKAVGTFIEHKFKEFLNEKYQFSSGNSANGIDFPDEHLLTDIKVTSIKQPQSSCPFKNVKQKIYGLGYNLLIFVYEKIDDDVKKDTMINFVNCTFINKERTADFQITKRLIQILENDGNYDDIYGFLQDMNLPADDITLNKLVEEIVNNKPQQGYLTISNALQWRLQYSRVVSIKDLPAGIIKIIDKLNND